MPVKGGSSQAAAGDDYSHASSRVFQEKREEEALRGSSAPEWETLKPAWVAGCYP